MTGRDWVWTCGAGLCLSLVPACSHTVSQGLGDGPPPVVKASEETTQERSPIQATAGSPYHVWLPGKEGTAAKPRDLSIAQTEYPAESGDKEVVAQAPQPEACDQQPAPQQVELRPAPVAAKVKAAEDPPLVMALRCFMNKRPAEALVWLEHYDKPSQDLLLCLLPLVADVTEGSPRRHDPRELGAVVDQLDSVLARLRPLAPLTIGKMCFCEHIDKFGDYRKFPEDHEFQPGNWVQVYAELQNFSSGRSSNGYSIHLASTLEIREFNGNLRSQQDFQERAELSQSRRHDFFNNYGFRVRKDMPPGFYTLRLRIIDLPTGRTAEHTLDFRVGGPAHGS